MRGLHSRSRQTKDSCVGAGLAAFSLLCLVAGCSSPSGSGSEGPTSGSSSHSSSPTAGSASALAPLHGHYSPAIDSKDFVRIVDNPYWPLPAGTGYHFKGVRGTTAQTDDELVLRQTKQIAGVTCTVVKDIVAEHGRPVERTFDWYAQDKEGNVWYMGEDSFELKNGHFVKADDSWKTGVNGAQPGIIMPANPRPGDAYRQEYYPPGEALDQARVLRINAHLTVPNGSYRHVLVTSERSPLEPQTEQKYYARGVGELAEKVVKGHHEAFQLIGVTHP